METTKKNTLTTYNIEIFNVNGDETTVLRNDADKRLLSNLPAIIESVEEDLADLLPAGYDCRITEWNLGS